MMPEMNEDDIDLYSLAIQALTERAVAAGNALDIVRLQKIADSGVLLDEAPRDMVRAIYPVIEKGGYGQHKALVECWIDQCAQSNPDETAVIVWNVIIKQLTSVENMPRLFAHGLKEGVRLRQGISVLGNRGDDYRLEDFSVPGILALNYSAGFRTIIEKGGWTGMLTTIPAGGIVHYPGKSAMEVNLIELSMLGYKPNDVNAAALDLENTLSCLDVTSPAIRNALADCLVHAHKEGWLDPIDGALPLDWVTLIIDAGCELRSDLMDLRVSVVEYQKPEALLHALCSCQVRTPDDTPDNLRFVNAARRLIEEGGANPNEHGGNGFTAFHRAIQSENIQMVEMLLEHGADPAVAHRENKSLDAMTLAQDPKTRDIETMLLAWYARQAVSRALGTLASANQNASSTT